MEAARADQQGEAQERSMEGASTWRQASRWEQAATTDCISRCATRCVQRRLCLLLWLVWRLAGAIRAVALCITVLVVAPLSKLPLRVEDAALCSGEKWDADASPM